MKKWAIKIGKSKKNQISSKQYWKKVDFELPCKLKQIAWFVYVIINYF